MKWGRQRRQQQQQQQKQEQGEHPSSAFSLLRVFPLSWVSKLKPTRSKPDPPPQPPTTLPNSKPKPNQPELRPRPPPPRLLSPERHLRRSSASDHLSFSPAVLDRLVGRAHEAPEEAPRRHSCAGDNDDTSFFISRSKARRPFESARFHGARTEEPARFRALSCRSCRADLERPHGRLLSGNPELSSETGYSSSDEDDPWRRHIGREETEAAPPRRCHIGQAPPPPKDNVFARMKPVHEVPPTMKCNWRSSGREEKAHRRCTSAAEPVAQDQHVGARRSFSLKQRSRVKVYSPRAAAARAAAKERGARKKVAEEEERRERGRRLESLAVVKWSVEPEEDFRESMVEMIRQRGMGRPEDMEGLLACYLALNADEYHDVIVKVFRQVWLEVRPTRRRGVASPREEQGEAAAPAAFELSSGL